jgi:CheY-like chemotaxis protein
MATSSSRRVLLVDDNRDSVETLSMLLQMKGHDARIAEDGEAALAAIEEYQPHIVLLDLSLPGMDGFQVAQELRQRPRTGKLVLVALTGWSGREVKARAVEAGFDFHLLKPVEWPQLERVLELAQQQTVETND